MGMIEVTGIAADAYFSGYRLEYGAGENPESFRLITQSAEPVWNGSLGFWDTSSLVAGTYTLRLVVNDSAGNITETRVSVMLGNAVLPLVTSASVYPMAFMPDRGGILVSYGLSRSAFVQVVVVDVRTGRRVWMAGDGSGAMSEVHPGNINLAWDGRDSHGIPVAQGRYSVVILARDGTASDKRIMNIIAVPSPEVLALGSGGGLHSGVGATSGNTASLNGPGSPSNPPPGAPASVPAAIPPSGVPSAGDDGTSSGTHDNGMGNGRNPKYFQRGSNPGRHGGR
jgi:hypothetical protein